MSEMMMAPKGMYRDQLIRADGRYVDYGWRSNIVVNQCRELLTAFMCGDSSVKPGIRFIALGRGIGEWDSTAPDKPVQSTSKLEDKQPKKIKVTDAAITLAYLDSAGSVATTPPTKNLQITVEINPGRLTSSNEPTFPLREFGLFGRYDGSDYMIDYVRHPVIHVGPADTLIRRIQLVF